MSPTNRITSKTRTWFVPTSPRSPHKLRNELELLANFDGRKWWEKDDEGRPIHQLGFARLLRESDFFEGSISEENPAFSARDRCRALWTFGFAFVDSNGILRITPAGKRLVQEIRVEELFLKQLLKWQYPSWQHGGNPRTRHNYLLDQMNIFPFVEALRIARQVSWLTKQEIAIFLLPFESKDIPDNIRNFREEIKKQPAGRPRKEFIREYHRERFLEIYQEDIESGRISTRETPTSTVEDFISKKMRNSYDYADAATRYLQYTGLFTRTSRGLEIVSSFADEVDLILNEMSFEIVPFYNDVDKFYEYMGDPQLPSLPWENIDDIQAQIEKIESCVSETLGEINLLDSSFSPPEKPACPTEVEVAELVDYSYRLRSHLRELRNELLARDMQRPEKVTEIVEMFDKIVNREVIDPPLFFEWNTWRAFLALDDCFAKPNFKTDHELMPLSHAGGREPDIELYFNGEYAVLVEVTLSKGERQYYTETEPVTRHVARFQQKEREKNGRKVFGIFIAPKINPNTPTYYYGYLSKIEYPDAGHITIIPLSLRQFTDLLNHCIENRCFTKDSFRNLLDRIENLKNSVKNGKEWYKAIPKTIEEWTNETTQHPPTNL